MELVTFLLAGKEYALEISQVREVIRLREITPIPDSVNYVEGVINLRGHVIPLLNLRMKLKLSREDLRKTNRIIIANINNHSIGILVDGTKEVLNLLEERITPPDAVLKEAKYLIGVGRIEKRLILIMDIEKLLTAKEKTKIQKVHGQVEIRKRSE